MEILGLAAGAGFGAVGGIIGGALLRALTLGTRGNALAGAAGGGICTWILGTAALAGKVAPAAASGGLNIAAVLGTLAGGVFGGIVLMAIAGGIGAVLRKSGGRGA